MKFRLINKTFYLSNPKDDNLTKYIRPVLQVRLLFFWITLKKFLYEDSYKANRDAKKMLNTLNKQSDL